MPEISPCGCDRDAGLYGHTTYTCWVCKRQGFHVAAMVPECTTPAWPV